MLAIQKYSVIFVDISSIMLCYLTMSLIVELIEARMSLGVQEQVNNGGLKIVDEKFIKNNPDTEFEWLRAHATLKDQNPFAEIYKDSARIYVKKYDQPQMVHLSKTDKKNKKISKFFKDVSEYFGKNKTAYFKLIVFHHRHYYKFRDKIQTLRWVEYSIPIKENDHTEKIVSEELHERIWSNQLEKLQKLNDKFSKNIQQKRGYSEPSPSTVQELQKELIKPEVKKPKKTIEQEVNLISFSLLVGLIFALTVAVPIAVERRPYH